MYARRAGMRNQENAPCNNRSRSRVNMDVNTSAADNATNASADSVERLRLTDFMDLPTLQEIQDSFAAVADVKATITDAAGNVLTQPTPTDSFVKRTRALAALPPGVEI